MVLRHVPLLLVQGDGKLSEKDEADMQNAECMQYVTSSCVLPVHTILYMQVYGAVLMQMCIDWSKSIFMHCSELYDAARD